jgi:hypothetical protein
MSKVAREIVEWIVCLGIGTLVWTLLIKSI